MGGLLTSAKGELGDSRSEVAHAGLAILHVDDRAVHAREVSRLSVGDGHQAEGSQRWDERVHYLKVATYIESGDSIQNSPLVSGRLEVPILPPYRGPGHAGGRRATRAPMPPSSPLLSLPILPDAWEIALLPAPPVVDGMPVRGTLLVVESNSHRVRLCAPVPSAGSIGDVLREAFLSPDPGCQPGRPGGVRLYDPAIHAGIAALLAEAGVIAARVGSLPAVTAALAALVAEGGGPQAPGLTHELDAWRAALRELATILPWKRIGDDVRFTFRGGGLDGQVATVIGHGGQNRGVVLYPSWADLDAHRSRPRGGEIESLAMLTLLLEPPEELTPAERAACSRAGLVFAGKLHAKAYAMRGGRFAAPNAEEQAVLRAAVQAVCALCKTDLHALRDGATRKRAVLLPVGEVDVEAGRALRAPLRPSTPLFETNHRVTLVTLPTAAGEAPGSRMAVVYQMRKPAAVAAIPLIRRARAVVVSGTAHRGLDVVVELDGGERRVIFGGERGEFARGIERCLSGPDVFLCLASGGASRVNLYAEDLVAQVVVPLRRG